LCSKHRVYYYLSGDTNYKTKNGCIAINSNGNELTTITKLAENTGVSTDVSFKHLQ